MLTSFTQDSAPEDIAPLPPSRLFKPQMGCASGGNGIEAVQLAP